MRMNHLDLYVPDVRATAEFLTAYFGLRLVDMRGQNGLAVLNDDAGMEIVISHPIGKFGGSDQVSIDKETYHIGFVLPSRDDVNDVWKRLQDSTDCEIGEPREARGCWLFYCKAPGRINIEVACRHIA